jgi:peptidoglycan-associated lipoprotein
MKQLILFITLLAATGCSRSQPDVYDDSQSSRYMSRGMRSLGGKHGDSQQILSRDDFMCYKGSYGTDYIPLHDDDLPKELAMSETVVPQAKESPGDPGSQVPGIDRFKDPLMMTELSNIFKRVHFPYNSSLVKGKDNVHVLRNIAGYLKDNPGTYIFVAGHCDERGAEAYNLALGSRRSNAVRSQLINEGVDPNAIFTISYGKERPLVGGHDEEAWSENRRAEFKIYKK